MVHGCGLADVRKRKMKGEIKVGRKNKGVHQQKKILTIILKK